MKKKVIAIILGILLIFGSAFGGYCLGAQVNSVSGADLSSALPQEDITKGADPGGEMSQTDIIAGGYSGAGMWDVAQKSWEEATPDSGPGAVMPINVTMVELMTNPRKYHGKLVRLKGVALVEFEHQALHMGFEDYKYHFGYQIWLEFKDKEFWEMEDLNGQPVIVEGRFDMNSHGHFGMYFGTLQDVTRFQLWSAYLIWEDD